MSEKTMERNWTLPGNTLSIGLSSYCQANCICCPHHTASIRNMNMEFDLFKKCVDESAVHGLKYLDLCLLGDSLLHPEKEKMLSYVRSNYPDVKIYASSTGLSVETEFICQYIDTLHVSFYGTTADIWNKVHGVGVNGGGYNKALQNVESLLSVPSGKRPYIIMTFLVVPENERQLDEWKEKWESVADEVIVWRPHNWAGTYPLSYKAHCAEASSARSCGRPLDGPLCVYTNGDVTPCCFTWDKSMVLGNVHEQSLEDIYFSSKRQEIQRIHQSASFNGCGLPCEKCDQIYPRDDALVYTNKKRVPNQSIYAEQEVVKFKG